MATAILQPHDCLRDQFGPRSGNTRFRCRSRKRSPGDGNRRSNQNGLVMGQVKILKRGEELKAQVEKKDKKKKKKKIGLDLCCTDRLGPDPETVKRQIRVPDLYAGVSAPHPSSLPFPTSFVRRTVMETDLRKLLKI